MSTNAQNPEQTATSTNAPSGCTSCACGNAAADPAKAGSPPPIQLSMSRRLIEDVDYPEVKTRVVFPLPGRLNIYVEQGDVYALGLKKVLPGCSTGCCKTTTPAAKDEGKKVEGQCGCDRKDAKAEKEEETAKDQTTLDLAPLGGMYELALEPVLSDKHELVRVLGAVYRKYDDDKVLLQLLPEHISHCKLFLHTHPVVSDIAVDMSKLSKHARHVLHRLQKSLTARDENGLLVNEQGWARIPDGYALNVSPEMNAVREGGTDIKLEISFTGTHHHDVPAAMDVAKAVSQDKHQWVVVSTPENNDFVEEREIIETGCHIVTGVYHGA